MLVSELKCLKCWAFLVVWFIVNSSRILFRSPLSLTPDSFLYCLFCFQSNSRILKQWRSRIKSIFSEKERENLINCSCAAIIIITLMIWRNFIWQQIIQRWWWWWTIKTIIKINKREAVRDSRTVGKMVVRKKEKKQWWKTKVKIMKMLNNNIKRRKQSGWNKRRMPRWRRGGRGQGCVGRCAINRGTHFQDLLKANKLNCADWAPFSFSSSSLCSPPSVSISTIRLSTNKLPMRVRQWNYDISLLYWLTA